jgi:regulator of sigma E protease
MPTLVIFILVFAALVIAHEGGHFVASRLSGVEVDEFGLGLPPRFLTYWRNKGTIKIGGTLLRIPRNFELPFDWYGGMHKQVVATYDDGDDGPILRTIVLDSQTQAPVMEPEPAPSGQAVYPLPPAPKQSGRQRGMHELRGEVTDMHPGTAYTLNVLPFGGFVRPRGENDPKVTGGLAAASPWKRLGVLLAGPGMNILLAALILSGIYLSSGIPVNTSVFLGSVMAGSPAAAAGFKSGDEVISINGQAMKSADDAHTAIYNNLDKPIAVLLKRNGVEMTIDVTPSSQRSATEGAIGVSLEERTQTQPATLVSAVRAGFGATGAFIHQFLTLPARIIENQVAPGSARFIGLKGMYDFMNQAVKQDAQSRVAPASPPPGGGTGGGQPPVQPTFYTWDLIALISLSLGIFNLLPIPALDGGRILFLLPELIFRRRVPPEVENRVHAAGMVALLLLMVVINAMDFINPVLPK